MDWSGYKQPDPEREHRRREKRVRGAALDTDARIMIDNGALQPIDGRVSVFRAVAGAARKARPGLPHLVTAPTKMPRSVTPVPSCSQRTVERSDELDTIPITPAATMSMPSAAKAMPEMMGVLAKYPGRKRRPVTFWGIRSSGSNFYTTY